MKRVLMLLPVALFLLPLVGCGSNGGDDPKIDTLSGSQAQEAMKHTRRPSGIGGGSPAGGAATQKD